MGYEKVYEAMKIEIEAYLVPRKLYDESQNQLSLLKSELEIAKSDLKKLKSEHSQLTETYNQLKDDALQLIDERKGDTLKIDVLQAEMKAVEAEKKTFEVKFDAVSSKLKLKTHQYDSLLKSKPKSQDIKICVTQESQKTSIETQTIKQEPEEIGVVNVPASLSSQPRTPSAKTGTKRTSRHDNRKITKAKRMKTENSDSRVSRKSTENKRKFTCECCHDDWGIDVERNHGGDPDKTGVPNPRETIPTFSSFDDYKNHLYRMHDEIYYGLVNCDQASNGRADFTCKICGLKFIDKENHNTHVDIEHMNLPDLTNKQIFDLHLKYTDTDSE